MTLARQQFRNAFHLFLLRPIFFLSVGVELMGKYSSDNWKFREDSD